MPLGPQQPDDTDRGHDKAGQYQTGREADRSARLAGLRFQARTLRGSRVSRVTRQRRSSQARVPPARTSVAPAATSASHQTAVAGAGEAVPPRPVATPLAGIEVFPAASSRSTISSLPVPSRTTNVCTVSAASVTVLFASPSA